MTNKCQTCLHTDRREIDRELVSGANVQELSKRYGISHGSLYSHKEKHLTRQMKTAFEKQNLLEGSFLLGKIDLLIQRTENIFRRNYKKEKDGMALRALAESRQTFELLCKISYALHESKLAELRLSRDFQMQQAREDVSKALDVLTNDELRLYGLLSQKIESRDKTIDVINQFSTTLTVSNPSPVSNPRREKEPESAKILPLENNPKDEDITPDSDPDEELKIHLPFTRKKLVKSL